MTTTTKTAWPASELRLTANQASFLTDGRPPSWSPRLSERTEESLSRRKMLSWILLPSGVGALRPNAKGTAALEKYYGHELVAANDNHPQTADSKGDKDAA